MTGGNLASNLVAVVVFLRRGVLDWGVALPMAGAQLAGGLLGARLAVKGGAKVIRYVVLAVVCTSVAFITFFALIREIGPDRATLITFVNPVVALFLGYLILDEKLSGAQLLGLPLVLAGCWLATRHPKNVSGGSTTGD